MAQMGGTVWQLFWEICSKTLQGSTLSDHCMMTGFGPDWDYAGGSFLECERLSSPVPSLRTPPETVWWTKSNFLGLFPKSGKDQWDWISTLHFPYNINFFLPLLKHPYLFWADLAYRSLLGYTVAKVCVSPGKSTCFTRLFLLMRGWGVGTDSPAQ